MAWSVIWQAIHLFIGKLLNKQDWKVSVDGGQPQPISGVTIAESGISFEFNAGSAAAKLEAVPGTLDHAVVKVNGVVDPNANVIFTLKHELLNPIIVVFEFKNVTLNGTTREYRFDNPA
ncbi:MAG TPA: hypothetical protein VGS41_19105 [Chthonomonadales bacterium]|nr:hypothetical protein [Chthonomonadales bacterium]